MIVKAHREPTKEQVAAELTELTKDAEKRELFADDVFFREAWFELQEQFCRGAAPPSQILTRFATLILKPECVLAGRAPLMLSMLRDRGFVPIHVVPFRFNRFTAREHWRYWLHNATLERLSALTDFLCAFDSLFFLVQDIRPKPNVPACVRLSESKGAADLTERSSSTLRASASSVQHPLLTGIHTADEPADVVRESGVLFGTEDRAAIFAATQSPMLPTQVDRIVESKSAQAGPALQFDLHKLAMEFSAKCQIRRQSASEDELAILLEAQSGLRRLAAGEQGLWKDIYHLMKRVQLDVPDHERILAGILSCRPFVDARGGRFPRNYPAWASPSPA